jgi:hypothetical protein
MDAKAPWGSTALTSMKAWIVANCGTPDKSLVGG